MVVEGGLDNNKKFHGDPEIKTFEANLGQNEIGKKPQSLFNRFLIVSSGAAFLVCLTSQTSKAV